MYIRIQDLGLNIGYWRVGTLSMHYWKSNHQQPMGDPEQIRDLEHNHKGMQYDLWLLSTRQTGGVLNNAPIEP
jgi:hypothetical protein